MKKGDNVFWRYFIFPIICLILFFSLIVIGTEVSPIEGQYTTCRDNQNRIMVGVICNEMKTTFFGMNEYFVLLAFIPLIICLIVLYWEDIFREKRGGKR